MSPSRYIFLFALILLLGAFFEGAVFVFGYVRSVALQLTSKFIDGIKSLSARADFFKLRVQTINVRGSELINVIRTVYGVLSLIITSYLIVDGEARPLFLLLTISVILFMPGLASFSGFQRVVSVAFIGIRILLTLGAVIAYYPTLLTAFLIRLTVKLCSKIVLYLKINKKRQKKQKKDDNFPPLLFSELDKI